MTKSNAPPKHRGFRIEQFRPDLLCAMLTAIWGLLALVSYVAQDIVGVSVPFAPHTLALLAVASAFMTAMAIGVMASV